MTGIDIAKLKARLDTVERLLAEQANRVKALEDTVENLKESKDWAYEAIQDLLGH